MISSHARARMRTAWGWSWPRARARLQRSAAQGLARRLSPAKSQTASGSCLSTAQQNATTRALPDWLVDGATPARQASEAAGNLPRASPISASSLAARTGTLQAGEDGPVGVQDERFG